MPMASINVKSVRDSVSSRDGSRLLVDRLWPRGVSKERAHLTAWRKELAPSADLRKWFAHDHARWDEFVRRYREELEASGEMKAVRALAREAREHPVTLLFGAGDHEFNQAVALKTFAESG